MLQQYQTDLQNFDDQQAIYIITCKSAANRLTRKLQTKKLILYISLIVEQKFNKQRMKDFKTSTNFSTQKEFQETNLKNGF